MPISDQQMSQEKLDIQRTSEVDESGRPVWKLKKTSDGKLMWMPRKCSTGYIRILKGKEMY